MFDGIPAFDVFLTRSVDKSSALDSLMTYIPFEGLDLRICKVELSASISACFL